MNTPLIGQVVGYVTPKTKAEESRIVDAKVIDVYRDGEVRLDYSEGTPGTEGYKERRAIATFNDDKITENTWHEKSQASPASSAPVRKSAKEAAAAS